MAASLEMTVGEEVARVPCGNVETLGRDKSNSIVVQDALSSRNHALIRRVGNDQFYLLDAGSRNGTYVNNQRVTTPTLLRNNDKIAIGETIITFLQETADEATKIDPDQTDLGETISFVRSDIRSVTILVADIRGYTTLSERIEITTLSKLMSKWFYEVQVLIEANGGRVDKFIGDCVMAIWDAQNSPKDMVLKCLRATHALQELTRDLGRTHAQLTEDLRIGVGLNTGIAAIGVGQENTVMGDTVNLAFRLESASKDLKKDVVVSQSAYSLLPPALWEGQEQEILVKGKKHPIQVIGISFPELKKFLDGVKADTPAAGAGPAAPAAGDRLPPDEATKPPAP